jgi:hypothetical protein
MPMTREQLLQQHASARVYQERYDNAFQPWGVRAPAPSITQDIDAYRRDLAVKAKRLLPEEHKLRQIQYRRLPDDILNGFEPQLLQAVRTYATDNSSVPYDAPLRRVEERDANGLVSYRYVGQRMFIHDFTRPCRRVVSFRGPDGRMTSEGLPLRG